MLKFVLQKMLNKKWLMLALLIGNILLMSITSSNAMYIQAAQQRNLQQQEMELQELAAKLNNEFNEEQARINQEARDSIQNFLKIYNQTKKYDYVMIKAGDNLLIANPQYNITKDIVTGLNKRYNANK